MGNEEFGLWKFILVEKYQVGDDGFEDFQFKWKVLLFLEGVMKMVGICFTNIRYRAGKGDSLLLE